MTSFTGSSTAMRRGATSFRCSRMQSSRIEKSIQESAFATPMRSVKSRKPSGVKPRQRPLQEAGPLYAVVPDPVLGEALVEPFVERAMVLELERAERVRDVFECVRHAVRPVVGG